MSIRVVVIFRKWCDRNGDVIALFSELPADINGYYCDAYEHVGQHGGADYHGVIRHTVPAPAHEAARLAKELKLIGYQLLPLRRASHRHHEQRRATARAYRQTPVETKSPHN